MHFGAGVLILDEPTAALGVKGATHILRIIMELRKRGLAVILITHNVLRAMTVGDSFGTVINGAFAVDFRKDERTREEITDLSAGGESMAEVQSYMDNHEGHTPPPRH